MSNEYENPEPRGSRAILTAANPEAPPERPYVLDFERGEKVFIRTVTHYYVGRVKAFDAGTVALEEATWIADTGKFGQFLQTGQPAEFETYPDDQVVKVARAAIVDVSNWPHALLRKR